MFYLDVWQIIFDWLKGGGVIINIHRSLTVAEVIVELFFKEFQFSKNLSRKDKKFTNMVTWMYFHSYV